MNFCKRHIVFLVATAALLAVGCYEVYWLHGLYTADKKSVVSIIRSAIGRAEIEEYAHRFRSEHRRDSLIVVRGRSEASAKFMSMSMDTLSGKPNRISVYRLDDPDLVGKLPVLQAPDIREMATHLSSQLDSAGLDIEYKLTFTGHREQANALSVSTEHYNRSDDGDVLYVASYINNGYYEFRSGSLAVYVFSRMSGIVVISAGILLIIIAAFYFMSRAMKRQRELDEMKNDFTRNMTHELKTPIAVAYAASDALLNCGLGDNPLKREEYLRIIKEQLGKLGGAVELILAMAMENRGGLRLDYSVTAIRPMLEEAASQIRLKAHKRCDVTVSVRPGNLEAVMDSKLMGSVVLTMLDNALKYSGESVAISVEAFQNDQKVFISISDNGMGIGSRELPHIFDKYYRVSTGDRHDVKGYGIGLFFAKSIVEKHGGKISVKSEPGKGSSFVIELCNG